MSTLTNVGSVRPMLVAIDGRCAAGKSSFAKKLQEETGCNVVSMDHFFLRPEQRTPERLAEPGGNVDWERCLEDVILPLYRGEIATYCPYDCHLQDFVDPIEIMPGRVTLVEGAYSCHPKLWDYYDAHVFLTIDPEEQLRRIEARNGPAALKVFQEKWIPMEELYFRTFQIPARCSVCLTVNDQPLLL